MDKNITQHFRVDEMPIIEEINGWIAQATDQYRPILTGFLNPRQRYIAETLINQNDEISFQSSGGFPDAEMQRMLLFPSYYEPYTNDFQLQLLQIKYPQKFAELHHRQVLGTFLSQGIERATFGDIITDGIQWQVVVQTNLADFFINQIDKIASLRVQLVPIESENILIPLSDWDTINTTVSSLRLDVVVASAFNYSRNRAKTLIEGQKIRVNWVDISKPDYPVAIHDMISVRHGGRIKLNAVDGTTKKDKLRVTFAIVSAK